MKRTKHFFGICLSVFAGVCAVAVIATLSVLWFRLKEYEASSADGAINSYFACLSAGEYDSVAEEAEAEFPPHVNREAYIAYLKRTYGSDFSDLRFSRTEEGGEAPIYNVYSPSGKLGQIQLFPWEENGKSCWKVRSVLCFYPDVTVTAPSFVTVSVNGGAAPEPSSVFADEAFASLETAESVPTRSVYALTGYLTHPEVTAALPDGTPCAVNWTEDGASAEIRVAPTEAQKPLFMTLAEDFSKLYARYISRDASFSALKAKMDPTTPFYRSLSGFANYWYTAHTGYAFRDFEVTELDCADENSFSATVSFDYLIYEGTVEHVYHTEYLLSFCNKNGTYLLVCLKIL